MAQADLLTIVIQWHAHPSTVEEWEGFAAEVKARLSGPDIQVGSVHVPFACSALTSSTSGAGACSAQFELRGFAGDASTRASV